MPHLLSKSRYIRGLQCERALWLDTFRPTLARYSREQMRRFDAGRDFEYAFKALFPMGIDISATLKRDIDAYPTLTSKLLDEEADAVLFEAGFVYDDVLVLADVVKKLPDGSLEIYEVKSGPKVSETYKRDAALQHYVISHCRNVSAFSIVHATSGVDASDSSANASPFTIVGLTEELASEADVIARNIVSMKEVLRQGEPSTPMGTHCDTPYACPYQHYCKLGVRQLSMF